MNRALPLLIVLALSCVATPLRAEPPRVLRATPDHGDIGVDPALAEIRVMFDQDMLADRSVCGGGATFPRLTAQPVWKSPRELVIPVMLEPSHRYDISINCSSFGNFRSLAGEACEITPISFVTGAAGAPPPAAHTSTPEANTAALAALFDAIDHRYSYRDRVAKSWPEAFDPWRDSIIGATTPAAFARAAACALREAKDPHLALAVNHAVFPTFIPQARPNTDTALVAKLVPQFKKANPVVSLGLFDDGIAYIQINGWPADAAILEPAHTFLSEHAQAPAIILDVRTNGGGDELSARRFAAHFVSERTVYSRSRVRDPSRDGGWTPLVERAVSPDDAVPAGSGAAPRPCRAPVAVLIGQACMSSNESFILMMKHGAQATLVGAPTFGTSGNPRPVDLGNGVTARIPTWEDQLPDGTLLEGRGVAPDVSVEFRGGGADAVLEAARQFLASEPHAAGDVKQAK